MKTVSENHNDIVEYKYSIKEKLFSRQSEFQKVEVYDTVGFGKMLLNDDLVMVTERDEFSYHDMIAHIPLFTHPNPKRVLIIGGGDGGTAREVLRHENVEEVVMVEIDGAVVEACKEFIPQTAGALDNPRLELLIEDGVKYMKDHATSDRKFDVILVDSTEPFGPATPLFNIDFYKDVYSCLSDDGIVISQGESPFFDITMQKKLLSFLNELFPICSVYNYNNLTYPGGLWSFSVGSKRYHPQRDIDLNRVQETKLEFDYYNIDIHKGAFCLPNFQLKQVKEFLKG